MSDDFDYTLQGFKELDLALDDLPKATGKNVLRRAAAKALQPVVTRMAQLAPYDPEDRDEDGRHLNETMRTQNAKARLARALGDDPKNSVTVLAGPAPIGKRARSNAIWQEEGTVSMPANPYARPAVDAEADGVIARVRDELAAELKKAAARLARKAARGR